MPISYNITAWPSPGGGAGLGAGCPQTTASSCFLSKVALFGGTYFHFTFKAHADIWVPKGSCWPDMVMEVYE
jgi:hypothetical protein